MSPEMEKLADSLAESIKQYIAGKLAGAASAERLVELQARVDALEARLSEIEGAKRLRSVGRASSGKKSRTAANSTYR